MLSSADGKQKLIEGLADVVAAEVEKDLDEELGRPESEERIVGYTHEGFVEERAQKAGTLVEFIRRVIDKTAERRARKSTHTPLSLEKAEEEQRSRSTRGVAQALAATYSAASKNRWRWMYAIGRSIVQRPALTDPFLQNVDFKTVPGAFAPSTLFAKLASWTSGATYEYGVKNDVIEVRDNVGNYKQGTSRAGLEFVVSVVTFGLANFLYHKGTPSTLQSSSDQGPSACLEWKEVPVDTMDISETSFEGANYSEKSLIEDEIYGYVSDQFEVMAERIQTETGDDGKESSVDPVIQAAALGDDAKRARKPVVRYCEFCDATFQGCYNCPDCGRSMKPKAGAAKATAFRAKAERRFDKARPVRERPRDRSVSTMVLPVVPVNPNNTEALKKVDSEYYKLLNLHGYVDAPGGDARQWLYTVTDEGAQTPEAQQDPRVYAMLGAGHEEQAYTRRLSLVGYHLGNDVLAKLMGFTDKAADILFAQARSPHKPWQLLMHYTRPAVTRAFLREFQLDKSVREDQKTVHTFIEWLRRHPRKCVANFYVLRELPALACFRAGVRAYREGNVAGDDFVHFRRSMAARKILMPVMWARHATRYAPQLLKETATLLYRMPKLAMEQYMRFWSHDGQGWDWKMEEANRRLKRVVTASNTEAAWKRAACILELAEKCRMMLVKATGAKDVDRETKVRTLPSLEKHIEKAEIALHRKRALHPSEVSDEVEPRGLFPEKNLASGALTYYERGQEFLRDALTEMRGTAAKSRVANMSTKAQLVPFGRDEGACGEDEDANDRLRRFEATEPENEELNAAANAEAASRLGDDDENED